MGFPARVPSLRGGGRSPVRPCVRWERDYGPCTSGCPWPTALSAGLSKTAWHAPGGIQEPADLPAPPTTDRLVVCHGDPCAPNTLLHEDGTWSGHVDMGTLGIADRWADLAVATWSTEWNYGPGWEGALLDAYGIAPPTRTAPTSTAVCGRRLEYPPTPVIPGLSGVVQRCSKRCGSASSASRSQPPSSAVASYVLCRNALSARSGSAAAATAS